MHHCWSHAFGLHYLGTRFTIKSRRSKGANIRKQKRSWQIAGRVRVIKIKGWHVVAIGNSKSQSDWSLKGKNVGYLFAIQHGAKKIFDFDDRRDVVDNDIGPRDITCCRKKQGVLSECCRGIKEKAARGTPTSEDVELCKWRLERFLGWHALPIPQHMRKAVEELSVLSDKYKEMEKELANSRTGYLFAIQHGAKKIFDFDDRHDVIDGDIKEHFDVELKSAKKEVILMYNCDDINRTVVSPYIHCGKRSVWPRDLPLENVDEIAHEEYYNQVLSGNQFIQQGISNGLPDVDLAEALHQLANGLIQRDLALHRQAQALNQKAKALHLQLNKETKSMSINLIRELILKTRSSKTDIYKLIFRFDKRFVITHDSNTLFQRNPISDTSFLIHNASANPLAILLNSASSLAKEMTFFFLLFYVTRLLPTKEKYLEVYLLFSLSLAQSTSINI
nr:probable glycosyltransferase STELLO2 [Tanacetum cinerariifolium]